MQKIKFVEQVSGISKTGKPYNLIKFTDGYQSFTVGNPKSLDFSKVTKGQDVQIEVEVSAGYNNTLRVDVVKVL